MTRNFLLSLSLLSVSLSIAAPLTPEDALQRLNNNGIVLNTRSAEAIDPDMVIKTSIGQPSLYIFNNKNSKGFIVVSADDAVTPLLGYSDSNSFDKDNISPAMQNWLEQYNRQIEYIRENPQTRASQEPTIQLPAWEAISPMIKTKWNQNAPYNDQCPTYGGSKTYTGCVATAMSQVMNYFQYPEKGQGKISYKCSSINKTLSVDFSELTFDWANMLNSYNGSYTPAQAEAVSTLMMATGYSVQMSYSTDTSGAVSGMISGALVDYFNYDDQAFYAVRDEYQYTEWAEMVYNNLKTLGPVIYDGNSVASGGHSFICDGYQGDGYFHFNWGWGGSGDGYFLLDALNPSSIGIGGGGGGFNFDQDCILNIQPSKGNESENVQNTIIIYGSVEAFFNGSLLNIGLTGSSILGWSYKGLNSMTIDLGAIFERADGTGEPMYAKSTNAYNLNQTLDPMAYIPVEYNGTNIRPTIRVSQLDLEKGVKYKVTNAYLPKNTDTWEPVEAPVGSYNYFYLTKTGEGTSADDYEIENFYPMQFECSNLSFDSDLYNGIAVELSTTLKNNNDVELTRGVSLVLYDEDGTLRYQGDTFVISLSPEESYSTSWITVLTAQTSTTVSKALPLYAGLYDAATNTVYYKSETPVTMQPNPGRPVYTTTLSVDDAEYKSNKYYVANSSDFDVTFTVSCTRNIFSYPVKLWVATLSGNTYWKELSYPLETMIVNANDKGEVTTTISYPDAVPGLTYYIVSLVNDSFDNAIAFVAESNGSDAGVESLVTPEDDILIIFDRNSSKAIVKSNGTATAEVYSLNGMKLMPKKQLAGENSEIDLSGLGKGIVMLQVTDNKGHRKTAKLAL